MSAQRNFDLSFGLGYPIDQQLDYNGDDPGKLRQRSQLEQEQEASLQAVLGPERCTKVGQAEQILLYRRRQNPQLKSSVRPPKPSFPFIRSINSPKLHESAFAITLNFHRNKNPKCSKSFRKNSKELCCKFSVRTFSVWTRRTQRNSERS